MDIEAVDIAILSHGHYDHGGGIETFLKRNARAILYAHADVFQPHCARREDGRIDDIGLDSTIALNPRIQAPRRVLRIDDELCIFSGVVPHRLFPPANRALLMKTPNYEPDDFRHEQNLIITEDGEDVLFTALRAQRDREYHRGRSHAARQNSALGGRRIPPVSERKRDRTLTRRLPVQVADALLAFEAVYYTGHCTGEGGCRLLKERLGDRVFRLSTGLEFKI